MQRLIETIVDSLETCRILPDDCDGDSPVNIAGIRVVSPTHGVGLIDVETTVDGSVDLKEEVYGEVFGPWLEELVERLPANVGVAVASDDDRVYVEEPRRIRIPIGKWDIEVGYDDWVHQTLDPTDRVYERMMKWLALDETDRLVDIGCGTGAITLRTAEIASKVVGIDNNPGSVETAEINAVGHGCENVRFVVGGWERVLRDLTMDNRRFSAVTIHPSTESVGRRPLAFLEALGVERLVYLGPRPQAAARDVGHLSEMGWTLEKLAAANLDPASCETLLMALMTMDDTGSVR